MSFIAGYEIDFTSIIRYELHERAFKDLTTMLFCFLNQQLYDKIGVPKIFDVNRKIEVKIIA